MSKLVKLEDKRRKLDKKQSEIDKTKREVIKAELESIFEVLGINAQVPLNYLNHTSKYIEVSLSDNSTFNVRAVIDGVNIHANVKSAGDKKLESFKKIMGVKL